MPTIDNEVLDREEDKLRRAPPVNGVPKQETAPSSSMIRVDYQKTKKDSQLEADRNSASPSSIQEEFYSYLGISSKANGDSDGDFHPTTTTPTSPLDEFDLSKRRSLRVRVVNKVKQHQAKLLKMAESNAPPSAGPDKEAEFVRPEDEQQIEKKPSYLGRLFSADELVNGGTSSNSSTINDNNPSSTILARRCYTNRSPSQSPSTTTNELQSPSSSLFLISKLAGSPVPPQPTPSSEMFSDFEEEIKKHVELSDRLGITPTPTTGNINNNEDTTTVKSTPAELKSISAPIQSAAPKEPTRIIRKKVITKRIVIRRKEFVWPKSNKDRVPSKWPIGHKRRMLRIANGGAPKVKVPPSTMNKLHPEFTIVQKVDDVKPYTVLESDVPLESQPGPVLGTYYNDTERVLLVVTERRVMFFQHHTNVAMFQKVVQGQLPSSSNNSNVQRNAWSLIDSTPRLLRDEVIDELMFEKRIMRRTGKEGQGRLVYVELRAQRLPNDYNHRSAEMTAAYLNMYSLSRQTLDETLSDQVVEVRSISLDTIVGCIPDISYTVFPNEMSVAMCWNERQPTRKRIGICKYKLSADLDSLTAVDEFQSIDGDLNGLRWGEPKYLIGTGNSQIVIWDHHTGILLTNIHLMDFELGETLYAKVMNIDKQERHLLLVQYWQNYLNVMHVNLLDFAYRVLKSRELTVTRHDVHSLVCLDSGDGANVNLALVTGGPGKCGGEEMLQFFDALTNRLIVMQRQEEEGSRLFLTEKYLIKLRLDPQTISIQSLNEFLLNLI